MTTSHTSGFTLIELSIVLIIIGSLIGGAMVGQSLIHSSEVNSFISEYQKFQTAVSIFEQKYDALPGDFDNAQTFWGAAADCAAAQTTIATCNGNGSSWIDMDIPSSERFLFWKHLANAGLISGNFIGIRDGAGVDTESTTPRNAPSGKISGSLWYINFWGMRSGLPFFFDGIYNHIFEVGGQIVGELPWGGIFTPREVWGMDSKMDDGKPRTGKLRVWTDSGVVKADGVTLATSSDAATALYDIRITSKTSPLIFTDVFGDARK